MSDLKAILPVFENIAGRSLSIGEFIKLLELIDSFKENESEEEDTPDNIRMILHSQTTASSKRSRPLQLTLFNLAPELYAAFYIVLYDEAGLLIKLGENYSRYSTNNKDERGKVFSAVKRRFDQPHLIRARQLG